MIFLCNVKHILIVYLVRHLSDRTIKMWTAKEYTSASELRDERRRKETTLQLYL